MNAIKYERKHNTWYAAKEGVFIFHDMGDTTSNENGTNMHGLFGAIIIEAAESTRQDPQTGQELQSGLFADIYNPAKPSFTGPEAINGMRSPECGEFFEYSKKASCANARVYTNFFSVISAKNNKKLLSIGN